MKKALVLGGVFIVMALLLYSGTSYGAPRALVQNAVYDAGDTPQGKEISNEFLIKNAGNEPLTIKVRPC